MREKDHIGITILIDILPAFLKKILRIFSSIVIIFVTAIVYRYSLIWISKVGSVLSPSLQLPFSVFYIMVPVSSILLIFYCLIDIISVFIPLPEAVRGYSVDDFDEAACDEMTEALKKDNFEIIE